MALAGCPHPGLIALCKSHKAALLQALPDAEIAPAPAPAAGPIDLAAFHERAAIREYDGGMARAEADEAAASEMGFGTAADMYRTAIDAWRSEVSALPHPLPPDFDKLAAVSTKFLASEWPMRALEIGWSEISIFGIHEGRAPRERLDTWGLGAMLAWGIHKYSIVRFERDFCLLRTSGGSELRQWRHRASFDAAFVWWKHPAIHGEKG